MAQNINILQELNELNSSLSGVTPSEVYQVPDGYFEGFAAQMIQRVKSLAANNATEELSHLSPLLTSISKKMPYEVPAGYFENLEERLNAVTKGELSVKEELASISPLLSSLDKQMPYEVPAGYFDQLKVPVSKPAAKVVSLGSRKWFRIAAAAVITGIVLAGTLIIINQNKIDPNENSYVWVKKNTKKVSTEKLEEFVNLADDDALAKKAVASTEKSAEVQELLRDVPQAEIESFLQDTDILNETDGEDAMMN